MSTTAYPNPTTNDFTVDYQPVPEATDVEFTLHNSQGTVLRTFRYLRNSQRRSFPLPGLPRGLYYLRTLENGATRSMLRLEVQ